MIAGNRREQRASIDKLKPASSVDHFVFKQTSDLIKLQYGSMAEKCFA